MMNFKAQVNPPVTFESTYLPVATQRRIRPFLFLGTIVTIVLILGTTAYLLTQPHSNSRAATLNPDCTLIVPPNPLTNQGLATPYQLVATDEKNGPCNEAVAGQAAFVQGAVFDPTKNQISIYNPLVVDQGQKPAVAPVVPTLPQGTIVALWFGFNGHILTLEDKQNSLQEGNCVNGLTNSNFGQFAYCNASAFFSAANQAIKTNKLVPPALGKGYDGKTCPTVRDFSVVDMDQSDNVTTSYLIDSSNQSAQMSVSNQKKLHNANVQTNGSDNRLLAIALDGALGCTPWMAPDLANAGNKTTALPLNKLQAAAYQAAPIALVPGNDPMVTVNGNPNLAKLNLYRQGVDQPTVQNTTQADTSTYCKNLSAIAPARVALDSSLTKQHTSPSATAASNLFTFLAQRFNMTWGAAGLNCQGLLKQTSPVTMTTDSAGVVIDATIYGINVPVNAIASCTVNNQLIQGCTGTVTINGQSCTLAFVQAANQVAITCPAKK